MRTLNLGILAHVDAGKTTLTERLLFAAGVIDHIGSVDHGDTQTDSLPLERQRGITIKSAVVSFVVDDVTINLIDTPGHPDFIAEVERVLQVLDGAILVVSAVEGVQAQTRILMRTLQRLRVPTLLFVNKIDRAGADDERVLQQIRDRLTPSIVPMGTVAQIGTRSAAFLPFDPEDRRFRAALGNALSEHDDGILAAIVGDVPVAAERLVSELASQTRRALVHPVSFGSAMTGAGVDALMQSITSKLPAIDADVDDELSATVFKIERGPSGERVAYVRVFSGRLHARDRIRVGHDQDKITQIRVFERGDSVQARFVDAGRIAKVWGLADVRIGDEIGSARGRPEQQFDPPTLAAVVVPRRPSEAGALHAALAQLAEQDPLIDLRRDDVRHELSVSLYGEVQKEVIEATLANDFGLEVGFRETTVICVERPAGAGESLETMGNGNPFLATIGLRVAPTAVGSGISVVVEAPLEEIPLYVFGSVDAFAAAMDGYVRAALREGPHGWQVTDIAVTMTRAGYSSPGTGRLDFKYLTPLVLADVLRKAGTVVCEPVQRFHLEVPTDALGAVTQALARLEAPPHSIVTRGALSEVEGDIAAAKVYELQQRLPGLTHGEGTLGATFDHYQPISGAAPSRPRTGLDPGNRDEYLRQVLRRT